MNVFRNERFQNLINRGGRSKFENLSFVDCHFEWCGLSLTTDIQEMSVVKNVELTNCTATACNLGPLIASDVRVTNLKTSDLLIFWSPYLDEVRLSGDVGKLKINATADPSTYGKPHQKIFDEYRQLFYASVDWALDISQAKFREFDVRGVPGRLIRRDPNSQILITRERALKIATPGWERQLDPANTLWPFAVNLFLRDGDADTVLVAPLGAAKAKRDPLLKGLQELRDIGLAESD